MRQYFRYLDDLQEPMFFRVEVDEDIITLKCYMHIFKDGLPEITDTLTIVTDKSQNSSFIRHNTIIEENHIQDVISGNLFDIQTTENFWFKYFGAVQMKRGVDDSGVQYINLNTSYFDRNYGKNFGYNRIFFNEWTDCSLWSFDFNFDGMNWFYPRNLFFETMNNKASFNRSEMYQSYVKAPVLIKMDNENATFASGENRKRVLGMFIMDKDDSFLDSSFYAKVSNDFGLVMDLAGEIVPQNNWKFSYPIIRHYNELPIPRLHISAPATMSINELTKIKVTLFDNEEYLITEDGDSIFMEPIESAIVLEDETNQLYEDITMNNALEWGTVKSNYLVEKDIDMYIINNSGYINKNKVSLKNGIGYFNFRALDMEVGDVVKIKVGFKAFSNISEHTIEIID